MEVERPQQIDRRAVADALRARHAALTVREPVWEPTERGGRWSWTAELAAGPTFASHLELDTAEPWSGPPPAIELTRALAVIDALSYWKAAAPAALRLDFPLPGPANWWDGFVAGGMAEFLWANGLDPDWAPELTATGTTALPDPDPDRDRLADAPDALLLHSGGKDSIVAGLLLADSGATVRTVTYQPTPEAAAVVAASAPAGGWAGPATLLRRGFDPQLLALNADGYLNGHTPYSAWLALAALAMAELLGVERVAAGNGASDDEPNITGRWRGEPWPVNHQWSKSAAFEAAWADLAGPGRRYASPLRPMLELAVVAGIVATGPPGTEQALSCNRAAKAGRPGTWCGQCPKCAWAAVSIGALAGRDAVLARLGLDPLADATNAPLLASMCGRRGPIPFECAGLPIEVRTCARALADAAGGRQGVPAFSALTDDDVSDGADPPTVAALVARRGPAPLLDPAEQAAVARWQHAALARL